MAIILLNIENMHCGTCVRRVAETLNTIPATHAEEVRIGTARVKTSATSEQIQHALTTAGYPAHAEVLEA